MNNKYNDHALLLELLPYPAFIAQDGKITHCNNYARQMVITPGDEIAPMLGENLEQFNTLQDGSINMDLTVDVFTCPAVITKLSEGHLFTMPGNVTPELKGMCQLSTHLRLHISRLFSFVQQHGDAVDDDVHRELHRINRIFNNVFNARAFAEKDNCYLQERDLRSIVGAVLDECVALLDEADIELKHDLFPDPIYTVCDVQMIKQALYNMIDNAVQYAPKGESIEVTLTKTETTALLTVKNPCKGICDAVRANMFNCYTRELHPDSGVFGVGIGMAVIQSAAAAHGGTVLLRECEGGSTQVTMTVPIKHSGKSVLHAPSITISVPQDDGTVMLSNVLPEKLYRPE